MISMEVCQHHGIDLGCSQKGTRTNLVLSALSTVDQDRPASAHQERQTRHVTSSTRHSSTGAQEKDLVDADLAHFLCARRGHQGKASPTARLQRATMRAENEKTRAPCTL